MSATDPTATSAAAARWGVPPVRLGDRRVLHPGRLRWLRALAWLALRPAPSGSSPGRSSVW